MNAQQQDIPEQKRVLTILISAQILSGAGLAAGITVGALLAQDMLGTTSLAGLPSALFTTGAALAAVSVGRISHRYGRRRGLALGYAIGALGSIGVVAAAVTGSVLFLFLALLVYGAGSATNLQARYAGADLASPARRGRAVSRVLVATTVGGVIGPNLAHVMTRVAGAWGIPRLAGPFILSAVAYGSASLVLATLLRPDPLLLARSLADGAPGATETRKGAAAATGAGAATGSVPPATGTTKHPGGVLPGVGVMVVTQLVMVAIMTMTPVYMQAHGHGMEASGFVIAIHVAAMYLPSPVTGLLVDRFGRLRIAGASGVTLLAAGLLAALAPAGSVAALAAALALLGIGWNFGLISGTAMITDAVPLATRARKQGTVDVSIAVTGATGGMASGLVVAAANYPTLTVAGGVVALAILPVVLLTARPRSRTTPMVAADSRSVQPRAVDNGR